MTFSSRLPAPEPGLEKMTIPLPPGAWHGHSTESVWVRASGDGYEVRNVPFYAEGLSFGDIALARRSNGTLSFIDVHRRGGHSTYRVLKTDAELDAETAFPALLEAVNVLGCTYERATSHMVAIDVPPEADIHALYALLADYEERGIIGFEEGHCGHAVS